MKKSIICLLFALLTLPVYAGSQISTVSWIIVRATDGLTYFRLNGQITGSPTCATSPQWTINEKTEAGKMQYSMLLAAHASGKKVRVVGTGKCNRWADQEDVNFIQILN